MQRAELLERLTHHVRIVGHRDVPVNEHMQLDYRELGLNSLQVLSVLVRLEDELGLEVDEVLANIGRLKTVGDLLDCFGSSP